MRFRTEDILMSAPSPNQSRWRFHPILAVGLAIAVAGVGMILTVETPYRGPLSFIPMVLAPASIGLLAAKRVATAIPFALLLGGVGFLTSLATLAVVYGGY
jgi:hypothetical protein